LEQIFCSAGAPKFYIKSKNSAKLRKIITNEITSFTSPKYIENSLHT